MKLRLLTWNIQCGSDSGAVQNAWPRRKVPLAEALHTVTPDLFCAQEALLGQINYLKMFLVDYAVYAEGRDGPGAGEHCPIFYKTGRFEVVEAGTYWLNDDTTRPGLSWDKIYNRICTWAHLRDGWSSREFCVWNTHFPLGASQRLLSIRLLTERVSGRRDLPSLVVGDFNEPRGPDIWPELREAGLADAFAIADRTNGFATFRSERLGDTRIDWVLATPEWRVHRLNTVGSYSDANPPSDHNGVLVELELIGSAVSNA